MSLGLVSRTEGNVSVFSLPLCDDAWGWELQVADFDRLLFLSIHLVFVVVLRIIDHI